MAKKPRVEETSTASSQGSSTQRPAHSSGDFEVAPGPVAFILEHCGFRSSHGFKVLTEGYHMLDPT